MWSKDRLPPVDLHLFVHVACPECGHDLYFIFYEPNQPRKRCYCTNSECALYDIKYWISLTAGECKIVD